MDFVDPPPARMALHLSLDRSLLDRARHERINLTRAAEEGVRRALAEVWRAENARAIVAANTWLKAHGTPLKPPV